ncbi:hypothetical protein E2562_022806 [Oryza meyeriana var. granulata]|uniref:Uncharacterized protein n=1 Tax=Oryza meyeriana var. granulata TaxID=110450 RepID=A0A6G1FBA7_9ORYZ|nr:hypothetical protein E2562_022806 [Oryza meyeriana var. granulata]
MEGSDDVARRGRGNVLPDPALPCLCPSSPSAVQPGKRGGNTVGGGRWQICLPEVRDARSGTIAERKRRKEGGCSM